MTVASQDSLQGDQEGGLLQSSADGAHQELVLQETGEPVQNKGSSTPHHSAEVRGGCILQEPPSKQDLLETTRSGVSQGLQSSAYRGEETLEDLHQESQEGSWVLLHWHEVAKGLEERNTGGQGFARGGPGRRNHGTREEPGQSHTTL